MSVLVGLAKA